MFSERPETILPELEAPAQPIEFGAEEPLVSRDILHDRLGRVVLVDLAQEDALEAQQLQVHAPPVLGVLHELRALRLFFTRQPVIGIDELLDEVGRVSCPH